MGAGRNSTSKDADRRKSLGAATAALPVNNVGTPTSGAGPEEARGSGGPRLSSAALVRKFPKNSFANAKDFSIHSGCRPRGTQ
jgi:hypothetical protein